MNDFSLVLSKGEKERIDVLKCFFLDKHLLIPSLIIIILFVILFYSLLIKNVKYFSHTTVYCFRDDYK